MLLQFRIKNFKSIADEIIIDMTAINSLRDNKDFIMEQNGVLAVPVASIFGANASGKSNILDALFAFRTDIERSLKLKSDEYFFATPFLFNNENKNLPTEFEIFFIINDREYRYGYSILKNKIEQEWLYFRKASKYKTKWQNILERQQNTFLYDKKYSKLSEYDHLFTDKLLALSFFSTKELKNIIEFNEVYEWLRKGLHIGPILECTDIDWEYYYEKRQRVDDCIKFLKEFDITIEDIIIEKDLDKDNTPTYRAYTIHNGTRYNVGIESCGTQKLMSLFIIINIFLKGVRGILAIDELDCQLHPLILRRIIQMFHDKEINTYGSQLIFSSHNLIVLDSKDLRRDEVWFAEKDENGHTDLYSLASFKIDDKRYRADLDFGKHYLTGRFGAIPYI